MLCRSSNRRQASATMKKSHFYSHFMLSPVHLVLPIVGGHYLAQHQGADVDHAHDPRKGHELVHKRVQLPLADLDKG